MRPRVAATPREVKRHAGCSFGGQTRESGEISATRDGRLACEAKELNGTRSGAGHDDGPRLYPWRRESPRRHHADGRAGAETAEHERNQRAGRAGKNLRSVSETRQAGRYNAADEPEYDQPNCRSHSLLPKRLYPQLKYQISVLRSIRG